MRCLSSLALSPWSSDYCSIMNSSLSFVCFASSACTSRRSVLLFFPVRALPVAEVSSVAHRLPSRFRDDGRRSRVWWWPRKRGIRWKQQLLLLENVFRALEFAILRLCCGNERSREALFGKARRSLEILRDEEGPKTGGGEPKINEREGEASIMTLTMWDPLFEGDEHLIQVVARRLASKKVRAQNTTLLDAHERTSFHPITLCRRTRCTYPGPRADLRHNNRCDMKAWKCLLMIHCCNVGAAYRTWRLFYGECKLFTW